MSEKTDISFAFAQLKDIRIHYAYAGNKDKPLLLCLHGFPEFWRTWQTVLARLSAHFFVVAPDLRGYNLSGKPAGNENYEIRYLVDDALGLTNYLGYERFNLVGHDWGGLVSWTLASLHPEVLHKLTIINSPHPRILQKLLGSSKQQIAASSYINKFLNPSAEEKLSRNKYDLLWRFGFKELVEKNVFGEADKQAHIDAWSQPDALPAMLASYRAAKFRVPDEETVLPVDFDVSDTLANLVSIPTQVIWGLDDTALTAACLQGLDAYVDDLTIHTVEEAGHGVIHERPELITRLLLEFFSG